MLKSDDASAVAVIRTYFEEMSYSYVSTRLINGHDSVLFPEFASAQATFKALSPAYRLMFSLFRQAHAADDRVVRFGLPKHVFEAMESTGLLFENNRRQWRTPSVVIVGLEGLLLAVSTPPHYPTALTPKQPVYLGAESLWLTKTFPPTLSGRRVLDICSGSGIQGLICAARGAASVVGLEKSPVAVSISNFNVTLNGLKQVEIRESDLFSALQPDETFDFVVCNPPFMPVMDDVEYPICGTGGVDGTRILNAIFEGLHAHLAAEAEGVFFCNALGDHNSINFNKEVLEPFAQTYAVRVRAYVDDKIPIKHYVQGALTGNLRNTCPELSEEQLQAKIQAWQNELKQRGVAADFIYGQVIQFWKGASVSQVGVANIPAYNPYLTDPLVSLTSKARAYA